MPAPAESFATPHHKLYDGIAPEKYIGTNKGRVAFITGASKGLGLESAKAFAASGASVFISARSVDALAKLKAEIEAEYKVPVAYTAIDVSKEESVKAAVAKAVETFGKIDIVVSNENTKHGVKAIAMHPGAVATAFSAYIIDQNPGLGLKEFFTDDPKLNAWTQVRLTSGSEDWLSGRFFDSTWGLDEVAKQKEAILEEDALKIRLALPRSA
ncbi:hypothetical protein FRC00_002075 [Tulasnella sp. 408]|nr:hypothetical protein FRC00_002075 [Tulasnella sp. 408]